MSRREYCQACTFAKFGVRTRRVIDHTCGIDDPPQSKKNIFGLGNNAKLQAKKLSNERDPRKV